MSGAILFFAVFWAVLCFSGAVLCFSGAVLWALNAQYRKRLFEKKREK